MTSSLLFHVLYCNIPNVARSSRIGYAGVEDCDICEEAVDAISSISIEPLCRELPSTELCEEVIEVILSCELDDDISVSPNAEEVIRKGDWPASRVSSVRGLPRLAGDADVEAGVSPAARLRFSLSFASVVQLGAGEG